jgi:hypothetical protein
MFEGIAKWFNSTFKGYIHKCPYMKVQVYNSSMMQFTADEVKTKSSSKMPFYPNGIYKTVMWFFDKLDEDIITITYHQENRYHLIGSDF